MAMNIVSTFSERLVEALNGKQANELAYKIGLSKQEISMYIHGTRSPKRPVIEAIARELNVSPVWLMGYDEPKYLESEVKKETAIAPNTSDTSDTSDVSDEINSVLNKLMLQQDGLMFCGKPMDDETKRLLKISLENTMKLAIEMDKNNKSD